MYVKKRGLHAIFYFYLFICHHRWKRLCTKAFLCGNKCVTNKSRCNFRKFAIATFVTLQCVVIWITFSRRWRRKRVVSKALYNLFQVLETGCSEALHNLCRGTATPVPRHCDTCSEALWHLYNAIVHPVQRIVHPLKCHCPPSKMALFTLWNGIVHPVKWHCSPLWNAVLIAVRWQRGMCSKMLRKRRFPFLFVICHTFVATRKCLCTQAFPAMVTNKQIKTKNLCVIKKIATFVHD